MGSICAPITGDVVGIDDPGVLADSVLRENLLEKDWGVTDGLWLKGSGIVFDFCGGISELYTKLKGSGFVSNFAFDFCALQMLRPRL